MRALALTWLALGCGCGPMLAEPTPAAAARAALVGALPTFARPEVFALRAVDGATGQGTFVCSATLIGERTLMTAAHCLQEMGVVRVLVAHDLSFDSDATPGELFAVSQTARHPLYDGRPEHDLALLWLERAPAVSRAWANLRPIDSLQGAMVQAVGYGTNVPGGTLVEAPQAPLGSGIKREVALPMRSVWAFSVDVGDRSTRGVCHGDSGGPSFYRFSDGVERVVGVHAATSNADCTDGTDARPDSNADFVVPWFIGHERPSCGEDGLCATGCAPADVDCRPDTADCLGDVQCAGGRCASDLQHPARYCSRPCAADGDCADAMTCRQGVCAQPQRPERQPGDGCQATDFCLGGTVCAGAPSTCVRPCTRMAECFRSELCVADPTGQHFCQAPAEVMLAGPAATAPAAATCSSSGTGTFVLLALGALFRYRAPKGRRGSSCARVFCSSSVVSWHWL